MSIPKTQLSHPTYRPDIDGLRGIAVLAVVIFHAFPIYFGGGFIGVDIFFVISGFLISTIIFKNLDDGTFSISEFYYRRIRRIFPALILVLTSVLVFGWMVLLSDEIKQLGKHIASGAGFISNLVLWSEAGYFDKAAETKPLLHLWSLGIEEQFYILFPFIIWFLWRLKSNKLVALSIIVVAAISFAVNVTGTEQYPVATFYSPISRFWELLSGSLLAWVFIYKDRLTYNGSTGSEYANHSPTIYSLLGFLLLGYGFFNITPSVNFPGTWALVPVLGALLIIYAGPSAWLNRKILSNKVIIWFGLISFPLYLWHWPALSFGRIIYDETPSSKYIIIALIISVLLSWLTMKFIEKPLRYGKKNTGKKTAYLLFLMIIIAIIGLVVSEYDFSRSHTFEKTIISRKGEHKIGTSLAWYKGKGDWLFLGNQYDNCVAKLKLSKIPPPKELNATKELFSKIAETASSYDIKVILILSPNKSSIYPEFLPDTITPSTKKYSSFFLDSLKDIPNLTIYDPTDDLLKSKASNGILYYMTDTHWNNKGSFLSYAGFSKLLGLPIPEVTFEQSSTVHHGDLIDISGMQDFPLHPEDNFDVVWKHTPKLLETRIDHSKQTTFGLPSVVTNSNPLSNMYIWVIGDSFTVSLKKYFNATFKEVRYVGHWSDKLKELPNELVNAEIKPDMIVITRVERSF